MSDGRDVKRDKETRPESKPMRHLYFQHSNKTYSLVSKDVFDCSDLMIFGLCHKHAKEMNPSFPVKAKDCWTDTRGRRWYDVGSKSELYVVF